MNGKLIAITVLTTAALMLAGGFVYEQERTQRQRLAAYQRQVSELLTDLEASSSEALALERRLRLAEGNRADLLDQLRDLKEELALANERSDPDYEQVAARLERRIRAEFTAELGFEQDRLLNPSRSDALALIENMEPDEFSLLMRMQNQYGNFLNSLEVDPGRRTVIVDALYALVQERDTLRRDLITQSTDGSLGRRQLEEEMQRVFSPDYQREFLSYALTDSELEQLANSPGQPQPRMRAFVGRNLGSVGLSVPPLAADPDSDHFSVTIENAQDGTISIEQLRFSAVPDDN